MGLGETAESITAFNKVRDVARQAITNQLYYKDLTIALQILLLDSIQIQILVQTFRHSLEMSLVFLQLVSKQEIS